MKRVNGNVYTREEWKRNQMAIFAASFAIIWGFILLWYLMG